jgi:inactivated superfamily I helicase
MELVES